MSIVLVAFPGAPKPNKEAIEREKKLEEDIERRIVGK
jgi:Protein serine/threonine phosphatase 2C, C-terminal domain.